MKQYEKRQGQIKVDKTKDKFLKKYEISKFPTRNGVCWTPKALSVQPYTEA